MNQVSHTRRQPVASRGITLLVGVLLTTLGLSLVTGTGVAHATVTTVTGTVSASKVTVGTTVTYAGTASADVTGAVATLQRQVRGGGWMKTASTTTVTGKSFELPVPTWWYGLRTYRVALFNKGVVSYSNTQTVQVTPKYAPMGSVTSFKSMAGDQWMRWQPCGPAITYRVNKEKAYEGAVADVKEAFARIRRATGLRFSYLGTTTKLPTKLGTDQGDADILVMWATKAQYPQFKDDEVAGMGGTWYASGWVETDGKSVWKAKSGAVWLNARFNDLLPAGFGTGNTEGYRGSHGASILHELGHVMGLDHVSDSSQLMYLNGSDSHLSRYEAGDLRGLARVGANQGCLVPATRSP